MNIKDFAKLARRNPKIILGPTEITENRLKCLFVFTELNHVFSAFGAECMIFRQA